MAAFVFQFARRRPLLTAGCSLAARYLVGDGFTQLVAEGKAELDLRRLFCFTSFGFVMGAGPIYAWMGVVMPRVVQPRLRSTVARCAAFALGDVTAMLAVGDKIRFVDRNATAHTVSSVEYYPSLSGLPAWALSDG